MVTDPSEVLLLFTGLLIFSSLLFWGGFVVMRPFLVAPAPRLDPSSHKLSLEIEALRQEGLRLRQELEQQKTELLDEFRRSTFQQLQTLLTNYVSIRQMIQVKPDLPAKNISALFTSLDNLLESWGYERIGSAWEKVAYDPQLHQPDCTDLTEGEEVYIRFVGYRVGDCILCPAKVSRTLPGGAT